MLEKRASRILIEVTAWEHEGMITATVIDARQDEGGGLGEYEFIQLPSQGDRISLPAPNGEIWIWRVLYVEHFPRGGIRF
jgi:hypothetical protein